MPNWTPCPRDCAYCHDPDYGHPHPHPGQVCRDCGQAKCCCEEQKAWVRVVDSSRNYASE
jgi:hypothetical protein